MVVMTAKVSKKKIVLAVLAAAALLCALLLLLRSGKKNPAILTNDSRVQFLASCGWEVREQPLETQEVTIPAESNEVFERYNALQRSQGFDLTRFAGQQAHRYVYEITNDGDSARASVLVCRGAVIGGDVTADGTMRGLMRPAGEAAAS